MAAPATTAIATPGGIQLKDGFKTIISFARKSNVSLYQISGKPPGLDGGDKIKITTMHNTLYHTAYQQSLIMLTDGSMVCAFDPNAINEIINTLINQNGAITVHFSDTSTFDFWGYIQKFEIQEQKIGEYPTANVTFVVTNYDPTNHVEAGPVLTSVSGT